MAELNPFFCVYCKEWFSLFFFARLYLMGSASHMYLWASEILRSSDTCKERISASGIVCAICTRRREAKVVLELRFPPSTTWILLSFQLSITRLHPGRVQPHWIGSSFSDSGWSNIKRDKVSARSCGRASISSPDNAHASSPFSYFRSGIHGIPKWASTSSA